MIEEITNLEFFAKGKRGKVFTGYYNGKKVAVKKKNPDSEAISSIEHEGYWIERLNKHGIGPKLIYYDDEHVVYEFIEGELILDYVKSARKEAIIDLIFSVFDKMYDMDMIGVDKEEMHRPFKHIFVTENGPKMIDFERCNISIKPKNVTQFCQCVYSMKDELLIKGIHIDEKKLRKLSKEYKSDMSRKNLDKIKSHIRGE